MGSKVLCNDCECLHFRSLDKSEAIKFHLDHTPFDDVGFIGYCSREVVGIRPEIIITTLAKYNVVKCVTRSDIKLSGHLDFTKLGPQFVDEDGIKEYERSKKRKMF